LKLDLSNQSRLPFVLDMEPPKFITIKIFTLGIPDQSNLDFIMGIYSHYKFDRMLLYKDLIIGSPKIEPTKIAIKIEILFSSLNDEKEK
jgi:hypothetical protein